MLLLPSLKLLLTDDIKVNWLEFNPLDTLLLYSRWLILFATESDWFRPLSFRSFNPVSSVVLVVLSFWLLSLTEIDGEFWRSSVCLNVDLAYLERLLYVGCRGTDLREDHFRPQWFDSIDWKLTSVCLTYFVRLYLNLLGREGGGSIFS